MVYSISGEGPRHRPVAGRWTGRGGAIAEVLAFPLVALQLLAGAGSLPAGDEVPAAGASDPPAAASFDARMTPFVEKHCADCHGPAKRKGDLDLTEYKGEDSIARDSAVWGKVVTMLRARKMPPKSRPPPPEAEVRTVTEWVEARLPKVDCTGDVDPGRVTIRRLNRAEYRNTVRDLLGVDFRPAEDFPSDDVGYGFDNIGDVLSLSPILLEKYLAASEEIARTPGLIERLAPCKLEGKKRRECARRLLEDLADRAYRRPATDEEVKRLVALTGIAEENGETLEKGIRLAIEALLVSPHFLYRVEPDPEGAETGSIRPLNDFELASRLSYFIWSSMPDGELLDLAREGKLRGDGKADAKAGGKPDGSIEEHVRRMLADPKSKAFVENFAGQWLQIRNLWTVSPDRRLFPHFDDDLRAAMERETEMFFEAILREDRSILDLLEADFTFVNERLARLYGIPGIEGEELRRVSLAGGVRGGILTHASVLTVTSNPTRTSPVKRGKWILEQVLGAPPPHPPPGVPDLDEGADPSAPAGTLRQRMEKHRADPNCGICHEGMDALGFGLENFDAVGAWRERDGDLLIDSSGSLPGGASFTGPAGLKAILKERRDEFARCLAEKVLTYALGRGLEPSDRCAVDQVLDATIRGGYRFSSLLIEVARTRAFQMRRSGGTPR